MLTELYISNYLFISELRIPFETGLTVITGETGAGKSVLVGAISLIFGDMAGNPEFLEKDKAIYLEASFDLQKITPELADVLSDTTFEGDNELVLARSISPTQKSSYFINGRKTTQNTLKQLKPHLIDFHHQRDQQKLLNNDFQLQILDIYAAATDAVNEFRNIFKNLRHDLKQLAVLKDKDRKNIQLRELYEFQDKEIRKARINPDEDIHLQQEYVYLSRAQEISDTSSNLYHTLFSGESSTFDQINQAFGQLDKFAGLSEQITETLSGLTEAAAALETASINLRDISENIAQDSSRLSDIQARLDLLNQLMHKHRVSSAAELITYHKKIQNFLDEFSSLETEIQELEMKITADFELADHKADKISETRQQAAIKLCAYLRESVRILSIPDAQFQIRIDKKTDCKKVLSDFIKCCSETGLDEVEYLFSANPGSGLKPLKAVVSGGELSRILLAIKKVLVMDIAPRLIILDEIDTGIGGKTADYMADFIRQLSEKHQILCITHLASIAAAAKEHFCITKTSSSGKTELGISRLGEPERTAELARMLSGDVTELSLKHAEELINKGIKRGNSG